MSESGDPPVPGGWAYGPGAWLAVLGERIAVLLPPSQRDRAGTLWTRVDDGAGFEALLDAVLAGGLSELAGLALVAVDGSDVRVLVRGDATVVVDTDDGPATVHGRDAAPWRERRLTGVRGTRVAVGDQVSGPGAGERGDEPFGATGCVAGSGLVRAAWVAWPVGAVAPDVGATDAATPAEQPEPVEPLPAPSADPSRAVGQAPEPLPAAVRLLLSSGEQVDVDGVVLIGREPRAGTGPAAAGARLVRVPSPLQEVSATHLEVRPGSGSDPGHAVVRDLGSTNGTMVIQPGRAPEELQPWAPVKVGPGAVLDLADGLTIQVVAP